MARTFGASGPPVKIAVDCFECQWRAGSHWGLLTEGEVNVLNRSKTCSYYCAGQPIFNQGDPCEGVFTVMSGTVAIRKNDSQGNSAVMRLRHAGETIGYRDFFAGREFTTTAEALAPSHVCFIRRDAVRNLIGSNPTLGVMLLQQVAVDLQHAEETLLQSLSLPARARMAHLLLALKERYGTVEEDGSLTIELPLARQNIAEILGTRPETIARTIHALDTEGVARFTGRKVIVPDLDRLLDEVEED
jgi:CRP/FNR family transcriptional regulator